MVNKMANVSFTNDQFRDLLEAIDSVLLYTKPSSFAACRTRFDGSRDTTEVEAFISTIVTYKKIKVSDEDAIEGLSLLLSEEAAIWWMRVKDETKLGKMF